MIRKEPMTDVVIVGIGQTKVGEHWDISLRDLAFEAIEAAGKDAGGLKPESLIAANALAPEISHQSQVGTMIADYAGLLGIEAISVEAAGASGGAALRMGYISISSGMVDVCLVVGVEKVTDRLPAEVELAAMTGQDSEFEADQGMTLTSQAALLMQRYLFETGAPREAFGRFALTAHENGATNPNAMYRSRLREEVYMKAGMVSEPLNMFDAAPYADGAAAIILARSDILPPGFPNTPVRITGSGMATAHIALHDRPDPLDFQAARISVERACRQAGIMPSDVDLFELHDAFSIYSILSLEAAGLAERGQGWKLGGNGEICRDGRIPISTFGGLKARGYPMGASGVYQAVEAVLQLRGEAGANQVPEARRALIQSLGGPASIAAAHILER
jgi:acetyl-CoA C-acetyltransferase